MSTEERIKYLLHRALSLAEMVSFQSDNDVANGGSGGYLPNYRFRIKAVSL